MKNEILNTEETANIDLGAVSGSYCCGKRMIFIIVEGVKDNNML